MPPKEAETLEERMLRAELIQQQQERDLAVLHSEMCETKDIAEEAKALALQTSVAVERVPAQVLEGLRKESRDKRFELRDWMHLLTAVVVCLAAIYTAIN